MVRRRPVRLSIGGEGGAIARSGVDGSNRAGAQTEEAPASLAVPARGSPPRRRRPSSAGRVEAGQAATPSTPTRTSRKITVSCSHSTRKASWPFVDRISRYEATSPASAAATTRERTWAGP